MVCCRHRLHEDHRRVVIASLGIRNPTGSSKISGATGGPQPVVTKTFQVDIELTGDTTMAPYPFHDIEIAVLPDLKTLQRVDGLLGCDILNRGRFTYHGSAKEFILEF